jgi:adenylate kinase
MQPKTIIFIGPQGSGKGTQIEKLKAVLEANDTRKVVDIQTGRCFRNLAARAHTFAEKKVASTLSQGTLQPDFLVAVLWGQAMVEELDSEKHLLIDGFPRTVGQVPDLDGALAFFERESVTVINLETPEEIVRGRMIVRSRNDDTKDSIEERLRWYREDTLAVLEFYKTRPNTAIFNIDGTKSIEEVHADILKALSLSQ